MKATRSQFFGFLSITVAQMILRRKQANDLYTVSHKIFLWKNVVISTVSEILTVEVEFQLPECFQNTTAHFFAFISVTLT